MIINVARVLNIKRHLPEFSEGSTIRLAYPIKNIPKEELMKIGFSEELRVGERVLPDSSLSRYSFENSEGKCVKRKDLPMEIAERYWEWSWEDRAGNSYWDYTYVPYKRYVREYYPPIVCNIPIMK